MTPQFPCGQAHHSILGWIVQTALSLSHLGTVPIPGHPLLVVKARCTFNAQLQVQQVPPAIVHSHLLAVKVELGKAGRSCGRTLKRPD